MSVRLSLDYYKQVDIKLIKTYSLMPIRSTHYPKNIAYEQKVLALIGRSQTQARDVFDLFHLLEMGVNPALLANLRSSASIEDAKNNALNILFEDFQSKVISYLPFKYQSIYSEREVWDNMVLKVLESLDKK